MTWKIEGIAKILKLQPVMSNHVYSGQEYVWMCYPEKSTWCIINAYFRFLRGFFPELVVLLTAPAVTIPELFCWLMITCPSCNSYNHIQKLQFCSQRWCIPVFLHYHQPSSEHPNRTWHLLLDLVVLWLPGKKSIQLIQWTLLLGTSMELKNQKSMAFKFLMQNNERFCCIPLSISYLCTQTYK